VSLYTAVRHPDKIRRLALIEAPLLNERGIKSLAENGADKDAVLAYLDEYSSSTHIKVSDTQAKRVLAQHSRLHRGNLLANALVAGEETMSLLALDKLRIPTLLLYGRRSDLRHSGRALHSALPISKYCLAWGDHNLPVQRGGWTGRQLEHFFAEQGKAEQNSEREINA
jgi:pimeloyl-ACP methyl ester carboxylesterase